jgi:hypothetical protein
MKSSRKTTSSPRQQRSKSALVAGTNPKLSALLKKSQTPQPMHTPIDFDTKMDMTDDNITNNEDPFKTDNILVAIRVRPESAREKGLKNRKGPLVRVVDKNVIVFDPSDYENAHDRRALGVKRGKDLRFAFDRVFEEHCTQNDVYQSTAKCLLDSVLDGYNATVFAYGATGT